MKIVAINDCEWYVGESVEACVKDYRENIESNPDYSDEARELTEEDMDLLKFEDDDLSGTHRTFREQLAIEIAEGGVFPRMFASTEY